MVYIENKTVAFFVIVLLAILTFIVVKPFILAIVSSMVLAYTTYPFYIKLKNLLRSPSATAAIISVAVILTISLSVWFLVPIIIRQTFNIYMVVQKVDFTAPLKHIAPRFFTSAEFTRDFTITINQVTSKAASSVMNRFENVIMNLPLLFMQFIVMLFVFFFTLRDGDKIVSFLRGLSPLKESGEKRFIQKFNDITKSVIYGMFIIGIVQGVFAGIGLFIFGVPEPLFLSIVAILFGIVPYIGTWAVWIPVSIALIVSGNLQNAIAFSVYQLFAAGLIEFFIRPYIIKKKAKIPIATVLVGMLGGTYAFGVVGLVIGPLILEYFFLFLEFYRSKSLHELFV